MGQIVLDHVTKEYPGGVKGIDDLSLDIGDGEFMVLVGPSGCGKSTALRSIAGLEEITSGTISIGSQVVNDLPPKDRDIAMVFQNYALYPHMTVEQNLAFRLQQADSPQALFNAPVNLFVAGFMGSPAMNFVGASLVRDDGPAVVFADLRLPVPDAVLAARPGLSEYFGRDLILGIRPSDFEDGELADATWPRIPATADVTEALGSEMHVLFRVDAPPVEHAALGDARAAEDNEDAALPLTAGKTLWTARVAARSTIAPGHQIKLAIDTSNLQFFDASSGLSIGHPP